MARFQSFASKFAIRIAFSRGCINRSTSAFPYGHKGKLGLCVAPNSFRN